MKIIPADGWCLNLIVELDIASPGTAGAFLRASAERRQVVAAFLSSSAHPPEGAEGRELATFITSADHCQLLHAAYGKLPTGLRGALARSGPRPHGKLFYPMLNRLLASPSDKRIVTTIQQLDKVDLPRLLIIDALPPAICTLNLVKLLQSPEVARDVRKLVDLMVENGIESSALYQALHRVTTADQLSDLWDRWSLKSNLPPHPIATSDRYAPITTGNELRGLALRYRNCVNRYLPQALDGESAFAEFTDAGACVIHLKRYEGEWMVEGVHTKDNEAVAPELYSTAMRYLSDHGIRARPRRYETIGEWNVLRRLTRTSAWEWVV